MTRPAEPERYVFVKRPRCPVCKGICLLVYKTLRNADGSLPRRARCADCNHRIIVVLQ